MTLLKLVQQTMQSRMAVEDQTLDALTAAWAKQKSAQKKFYTDARDLIRQLETDFDGGLTNLPEWREAVSGVRRTMQHMESLEKRIAEDPLNGRLLHKWKELHDAAHEWFIEIQVLLKHKYIPERPTATKPKS